MRKILASMITFPQRTVSVLANSANCSERARQRLEAGLLHLFLGIGHRHDFHPFRIEPGDDLAGRTGSREEAVPGSHLAVVDAGLTGRWDIGAETAQQGGSAVSDRFEPPAGRPWRRSAALQPSQSGVPSASVQPLCDGQQIRRHRIFHLKSIA